MNRDGSPVKKLGIVDFQDGCHCVRWGSGLRVRLCVRLRVRLCVRLRVRLCVRLRSALRVRVCL